MISFQQVKIYVTFRLQQLGIRSDSVALSNGLSLYQFYSKPAISYKNFRLFRSVWTFKVFGCLGNLFYVHRFSVVY